jgi:hypothetical protein
MLSFVGAGNGFVSIWYDQSGNGYNLTQEASANQHRIVNAGSLQTLNGKPALVNYSGIQYMKVSYGITYTQANTAFQVGSHTNAASVIFDSFSTRQQIYSPGNTGQVSLFAGNQLSTSYLPSIATQRLIYGLFNGMSSKVAINNGVGSTGNAGTQAMDGLTLNASYLNSSSNNQNQQELIIWNSNKDTDRTGISNNINSFYSIY